MDSIVCYTEEIDDLEVAIEEIEEQLEDFTFQKNSLGIFFAEEDTEFDELYEEFSKKWDFPIICSTGMALLLGEQGLMKNGLSLMILTADDCTFTAGMTPELTYDNYRQEIQKKYDELKAGHSSEIKLIISYGGMTVSREKVASDDLVYALSDVSGGVPVYGGTAADGFSYNGFRVSCNGEVTTNGQVMALISGNIDPKFVVINSVKNRASFSYEVAKAENNTVYQLGHGTFQEALKRENMESDKTDVLGIYILSPFVVDIEKEDGDRVEVARNLTTLNQADGSGSFLGVIPEGAVLNVGVINRADVRGSVQKAFDAIWRDIGENTQYRTLLCTSCGARFMALASDVTAESETYLGRLPEGVSLMGMYSYGEYCPVEGSKTGRRYNMFHNFTFTILAI
ncbi:MAG: FIST N-terminal domain-containing protein [Eubacterium sp.]|nr:FIST N-terminal domain-containing protein [Eubacterium sp.]